MSAKSFCIDEIENFVNAKTNFEIAKHEKREHKIRHELLPELGREIQMLRSSLSQCLKELIENK